MTHRRVPAAALVLALGACGGGAPEAPAPSETPLAYSVPATNPVTYASSDTARINIHLAPGQVIEQTMGQTSTVRLSFSPGAAGALSVAANYTDFNAFMESSMMPRQDVGNDAFDGEFVLSLSPEGDVETVSGPELPEEVQQMTMGGELFADFFVRLPGRIAQPGETWTDTVRVDEETAGTHTVNETIVVSTFRGDTTVAGRTLWIIDATKTSTVVIEGDMQGMQMRNELSGSMAERTLWDPARRVMHSTRSTGSMTGSVSIPAAGMTDIPLDVSNSRYVRLVESGT